MPLDRIGTEELAGKILLHSRRRISHIAPSLLEAIYALPEQVRPLPGPYPPMVVRSGFTPKRWWKIFARIGILWPANCFM